MDQRHRGFFSLESGFPLGFLTITGFFELSDAFCWHQGKTSLQQDDKTLRCNKQAIYCSGSFSWVNCFITWLTFPLTKLPSYAFMGKLCSSFCCDDKRNGEIIITVFPHFGDYFAMFWLK